MTVLLLLPFNSAWADTEMTEDDAAFFEFLGSFEAEDDEWLDAQMFEEGVADDETPAADIPEEDQ